MVIKEYNNSGGKKFFDLFFWYISLIGVFSIMEYSTLSFPAKFKSYEEYLQSLSQEEFQKKLIRDYEEDRDGRNSE